jgi:hypothetical protein
MTKTLWPVRGTVSDSLQVVVSGKMFWSLAIHQTARRSAMEAERAKESEILGRDRQL